VSGSNVHTALLALTAAFSAAAPTGWTVVDRRPYDPRRRFLAVGWDNSDQPAVHVARGFTSAAGTQNTESVDVTNLLSLWAGNELKVDAEAEAFAAFDVFDQALAADLQLGDAAMLASISTYEYQPAQAAEGVLAQIRFTVHVEAWK
jgi:hypothetical protein